MDLSEKGKCGRCVKSKKNHPWIVSSGDGGIEGSEPRMEHGSKARKWTETIAESITESHSKISFLVYLVIVQGTFDVKR